MRDSPEMTKHIEDKLNALKESIDNNLFSGDNYGRDAFLCQHDYFGYIIIYKRFSTVSYIRV